MNELRSIVFSALLLLVGCAGTNYKPSTAGVGVRDSINTTRDEIQHAKAANVRAGTISDTMGKNLDQADRKNVLIRRWFELNDK
jgi:hypothetical protein